MVIKDIVKNCIGIIKSFLAHVKSGKNVYIAINVHFRNRGKIILGNDVIIRPSCDIYTISKWGRMELGDQTELGNHSTISCMNSVVLEDGVLTGPHVFIADHNHEYRNPYIPIFKQGVKASKNDKVFIGEGSWIGTNAVIVGNVNIGKHCVIGANSVVTHDVPDYCVAAGNPCKVIKKCNFDTHKWERVRET